MKVSLDPKICSNPDQSTRLLPKFFETHTIFQNLVLTSLYVTKFSVKRTIFFTLVVEKYMKKKPRCSKQILPVAFIISRFHCIVSRRDCLFLVLFTCVVLTPPPPPIPSYIIYSNSLPLPSLAFYGPPPAPSFARFCDIRISSLISYPHLLLTKPKARSGQIRFVHMIACQECDRRYRANA